MAHELAFRADGSAEIAYVGEKPWHGLGDELPKGATPDDFLRILKLPTIKRSRVRFGEGPNQQTYDGAHVLFRHDNKLPLGIVSPTYKIVQPVQMIEFFRDVADTIGGHLETAGVLFGGKRYWALANLGEKETIRGNDTLAQYLLLTSSADGSSATEARETCIRAVCNNTVSAALSMKTKHAIKVSHRSTFDAAQVKRELAETKGHFAAFVEAARTLSRVSVTNKQAEDFLTKLLADSTTKEDVSESTGFKSIMSLFKGNALGGTLLGVPGTAWGLVNAVTEHVDHKARAQSTENRIASAWFGRGDDLKTKAVEAALALA